MKRIGIGALNLLSLFALMLGVISTVRADDKGTIRVPSSNNWAVYEADGKKNISFALSKDSALSVVPGTYRVCVSEIKSVFRVVTVHAGKTVTVKTGAIKVPISNNWSVRGPDGTQIFSGGSKDTVLPLFPGKYRVYIPGSPDVSHEVTVKDDITLTVQP